MTAPTNGAVRDFDFHPGEPFVRVFDVPCSGVLRLDDDAFVAESRHGDLVLRHYAFTSEWFKVNVTLDRRGRLVETAAGPDHPPFAFNCDIATPMRRAGWDVFAVDLFADVPVRADGRLAWVTDEDELDRAGADGLVSRHEFASARAGLARLLGLIEAGGLISFLEDIHPFGSSNASLAFPARHVSIADVPHVQRERRWTSDPPSAQRSIGRVGSPLEVTHPQLDQGTSVAFRPTRVE